MRKIICSICLIIISSTLTYAQYDEDNAVVRNYLNSVFQNIDKSKVPTGYLKDYAFEYIDMSYYDGTELTDSNYVNSEILEMILKTVNSSALQQKPFVNTTDMLYDLFCNEEMIPVPIALYKYSNIKETAIDDGLIRYENGKVYDVYNENGIWLNPYETKYVLGFAPMANESYLPRVLFDFSTIYTNVSICDIDFDPGDGSGYRRIYKNDVVRISYPESGEYEMKLRIILYDGVTLETHTTININVLNPRAPFEDDLSSIYVSNPIKYNELTAYYKIKYKSSGGGLTKPIIVVEGFDPVMLGDTTIYGSLSLNNMVFPYFVTNSYDVVYVDFLNSEKDIFENAELLKIIIREINNIKHQNGSEEKNIIVGQSLGGVISRVALREMEMAGELHETTTFVSHDSPHLGANVPIGLLYTVRDLISLYSRKIQRYESLIDGINKINEYIKKLSYVSYLLESPAVKQILTNYVTSYGVIDNSYNQNFLDQLNTLGFPMGDIGYPIRNMAITKSGSLDLNNTYDKILSLNETIDKWVYWAYQILGSDNLRFFRGIGSNTNININLNVFPYKYNGGVVSNYEITYNKRIFGRDETFIIDSKRHTAPLTGPAYDVIPSSYLPLSGYKNEVNGMSSLELTDSLSFIPTASALCYKNGVNIYPDDYSKDFYSTYLSYPSQTPFEDIRIQAGQGIHEFSDSITIRNEYLWIIALAEAPRILLSGPVAPVDGDVYAMRDCEYPVTWNTSDNNVASIDENGVLSVHSNGFIDIMATVDKGYRIQTYEKRVMVGFPDYTLSSFEGLAGYSVTSSTSAVELLDFVELTNIKYHWGVLYSGTENTVWTEVRPSGSIPPLGGGNMVESFNVDFAGHSNSRMALVTFYVSNSAGESERYTTTIINNDYVSDELLPVLPPIIIVNSEGEILDSSSGEVVNVQTKSVNSEYYYLQIESDGISIELEKYPSESDIISVLLADERFLETLNDVKPWGEEDLIIKTLSLYGSEDNFLWSVPLTIMYSEEF